LKKVKGTFVEPKEILFARSGFVGYVCRRYFLFRRMFSGFFSDFNRTNDTQSQWLIYTNGL